jgi:DNA modification methylase
VTVKLLVGDCREQMALLEPNSIQTVTTSPPYWGLRDYGVPSLVWGGEPGHAHEWGAWTEAHDVREQAVAGKSRTTERFYGDPSRKFDGNHQKHSAGAFCDCGAWLGALGLEPTPELFIEHMVEVFRGVRRVLRDDGTLWLNLGDSYAGSGKGPTGHNGIGTHDVRQGFVGTSQRSKTDSGIPGYKPKDLMMIPARVAMALQADGWYLRSQIPWLKRNSMPESVTDRPATAVEYVYLLSKSRTYYWDADAVRVSASENTHSRGTGIGKKQALIPMGTGNRANEDFGRAILGHVTNRNRRNSDWFFESWQGMMLDEQGDPLAFIVNPRPFKGAHFATFPPQLVEPMVKAASRIGDTVLDPFGGSGTVGLVADRLDRHAVLCELKPDYADMGTNRIVGDAPMFVDLSA